jgi:chorismate-pyruvate lyase
MEKRRSRSQPPVASRRPSTTNGLLYPLDATYARAGVAPPVAERIAADAIPDPYRSLLAHENDMTTTLERHFGARVSVRLLSSQSRGRWCQRRVLLVQERSGRPVEMGAVRLDLAAFDARVRDRILGNEEPLGRILRSAGIDFRSQPKAFLALTPNAEMMGVFWMREPSRLYGRRTVVVHHGTKIGDIVEVLPPAEDHR